MTSPVAEGSRVTLCQWSSSQCSGSSAPLSVPCRSWLAAARPHSTRTVCHVHVSHDQACFVCCVSGSTRSPRAARSPRHSRSQGEPDPCQAMPSLPALHGESPKPKEAVEAAYGGVWGCVCYLALSLAEKKAAFTQKPKFCWPVSGLHPLPEDAVPEMNPVPVPHLTGDIPAPLRLPHLSVAGGRSGRCSCERGWQCRGCADPPCVLFTVPALCPRTCCPPASQARVCNLQPAAVS